MYSPIYGPKVPHPTENVHIREHGSSHIQYTTRPPVVTLTCVSDVAWPARRSLNAPAVLNQPEGWCSRTGMVLRDRRRAMAVAMAFGCAIAAYRRKKVPSQFLGGRHMLPWCKPWRYRILTRLFCAFWWDGRHRIDCCRMRLKRRRHSGLLRLRRR
jgi:hypothetical protein